MEWNNEEMNGIDMSGMEWIPTNGLNEDRNGRKQVLIINFYLIYAWLIQRANQW